MSTSKRGARRAEARAGRTCPVCGKPINAQRSTRRFCSTACRVKFQRDSGGTRAKGLRPGQGRILKLLADIEGGLCRETIAQEATVNPSHLSDLLGHVDPAKRAARDTRTGITSLLSLGYVELKRLEIEIGLFEKRYYITASGRQALGTTEP